MILPCDLSIPEPDEFFDEDSYRYLAESARRFFSADDVSSMLSAAGLEPGSRLSSSPAPETSYPRRRSASTKAIVSSLRSGLSITEDTPLNNARLRKRLVTLFEGGTRRRPSNRPPCGTRRASPPSATPFRATSPSVIVSPGSCAAGIISQNASESPP